MSCVGLDAGAVVRLGEELDVAGEAQHRPGRGAEHGLRHLVGLREERVGAGHAVRDHRLEAAEELLVLELLVGEAHEGLQRHLVAHPVVAAHLQDLGADEALDEAEHVGVGAALDLAEEALPGAGRGRAGAATIDRPSGRNFLEKSKARPRITSRSISQRMRLETSMHLA